MPKILGVGSSPRKGGNSDVLVRTILEGAAEAGAETEKVLLRNYKFDSCIGCERCRKDEACTGLMDGMQLIYPKIEQSPGMVMVTPVHNYNVSAMGKAYIDRLYCYYRFFEGVPRCWNSRLAGQGRKAVIAAVAEQMERRDMGFALEAMRMPLEALGYEVIAELPVFGIFDRGKVAQFPDVLDQARRYGADLARALAG